MTLWLVNGKEFHAPESTIMFNFEDWKERMSSNFYVHRFPMRVMGGIIVITTLLAWTLFGIKWGFAVNSGSVLGLIVASIWLDRRYRREHDALMEEYRMASGRKEMRVHVVTDEEGTTITKVEDVDIDEHGQLKRVQDQGGTTE